MSVSSAGCITRLLGTAMHRPQIFIILLIAIIRAETINGYTPVFLNPALSASIRLPAGINASHWKKYPTIGARFEIPSYIPKTNCIAGFEAGRVWNKSKTQYLNCVHLHFGVAYNCQTSYKYISFQPTIRLTNTVISNQEEVNTIKKMEFFSDIENEFGISVGIEPRINIKNLFITLPVQFERTFSSPECFDLLVFSISTGYKINL